MVENYSQTEEQGSKAEDKFIPDQTIVLPSVAEVSNGGWFNSDNERVTKKLSDSSDYWWLRSPGGSSDFAMLVSHNGGVVGGHEIGVGVNFTMGIRPAFRLDLSSVLFTSDASGASKSSITVGDSLLSVPQAPTGDVKLTVLDDAMNQPKLTFNADTDNSNHLHFGYAEAATGTGQLISCVLVQGNGAGSVKYYGKLADCATAESGELYIDPSTLQQGTYTLKIFGEQENDPYCTDYASEPVIMKLTVDGSGNGKIEEFTGDTAASPTITTDPSDQSANEGDTATFTVAATGGALSYQWQVSTDSGGTWSDVTDGTGGDTASYTTPATDVGMNGYRYRVVAKNFVNEATSNSAILTVNPATTPTVAIWPNEITLILGEPDNGDVIATADAQNFSSGPVTFSIDGTPTLPAGLDIDPGEGRIYVDDASLLVVTPTTIVTVKAVYGLESATDSVTITIKESGGSPDPGPTSLPSATIDNSTLQVDDTATLRVSLGQSGGASMATGAHIAVDNEEVVSVNRNSLDADGDVTVTAIRAGETDIRITFERVSGHDKTLHVTVSDSGTTPPVNPPTTSSGGRSSSGSSGDSSTPDRQVAKTILPASAFAWEDRALTIDHDSISVLGLLSVQWDGKTLTRGTDYGVYQGSVIVRFSEDFMAAQSPGDHTVRVEFLNHSGETTVMVGDTGTAVDPADNNTHNPNTGGYPDGSYPGATDNPNTGDGRGIWFALLLGSLGGIALVVRRLKPVA